MRKFSDEERERIREELIQTANDLLLTYGPTKTTVEDITDPVGIAKPTFYQFFDAKADLYVEIFEREFDEFTEEFQSELAGIDDPRERLEQFFRCYVDFAEGNQFIKKLFLEKDYRDVIDNMSPEQIVEIEEKEMRALIPPIEDVQAQSEGPISEMEPITVLGLMGSSLGLLVLHKDEYVEYAGHIDEVEDEFYYHIQEEMISTLARGLTVQE